MAAAERGVAAFLRRLLDNGASIDLDGLGTLKPSSDGRVRFLAARRLRIFLAYVSEDRRLAERLYRDFRGRGHDPWLDRRKLLPGQNWPRAIQQALETADFCVACFSSSSVSKRGIFQAEIRYALDCARLVPLDDVFLIPVRFDDCQVPGLIARETQCIDLFPDWDAGLARILEILDARAALLRRG
jgi:hypothetical protein